MIYLKNLKDLDPVIASVNAGQKIQAIKELRAITGLGLRESKDVIDQVGNPAYPSTMIDTLRRVDDVCDQTSGLTYDKRTDSPIGNYEPSIIVAEQAYAATYQLPTLIRSMQGTLNMTLNTLLLEQRETNQLLRDLLEALA